MNTNGLARHYDRLTPSERLPLMLAAAARGDEAEHQRLLHSAPRIGYEVPNFYGMGEGLLLATLIQAIRRLDVALMVRKASAMLAEARCSENEDQEQADRFGGLLRLLAYALTIETAGWRLFCEELKIDPDFLLSDLILSGLNNEEELARHLAFTPEEVKTFAQRHAGREVTVKTADTVAAELRRILAKQAGTWK